MWSVGVIVYQMITGKLPFESNEKDTNDILYNSDNTNNHYHLKVILFYYIFLTFLFHTNTIKSKIFYL